MIGLIRRWLKAGVLGRRGEIHPNEEGIPQGPSISVLLSKSVPALCARSLVRAVVKPRLQGEADPVRYIDDFVVCFQHRADALRVQEALAKRPGRFSLTGTSKTKLVKLVGCPTDAGRQGRKRPRRSIFWASRFTVPRNQKGNFKVGLRTEKSRLQRSLTRMKDLMGRMRHLPVKEQVIKLNGVLRGHYAYYGIAGNIRALLEGISGRRALLATPA
ncbi:MAG: RNA-directed DNA polymerase [Deltaproteobacteria bacterium]|nr:RNA-directed DNA polymerase [Deltaproteobacteria bacterium]